jgi:oligopeptide transport system permease protein
MRLSDSLIPRTFAADDFAPLTRVDAAEAIVRPSLSYWQDAWRRLKRNRRALWSLYLIVGLLSFSYVLPWLMKLDPVGQDLTQISQAPGLERQSLVVDTTPWAGRFSDATATQEQPLDITAAVSGLRVVDAANTESVRLTWEPLAGAVAYEVYRHLLVPSGPADLGLPLGQTELLRQISFEDRLKLENVPYYYSVRAVSAQGEVSDYATVLVTPRHAIGIHDAVRRGLVDSANAAAAIGSEVELRRHLMGTDYLGRDLLARLVYGGQTSLFIGVVAPLLFVALGVIYGGLAGYLGGRTDEVMMRFADFVIALPFLLFMILFRVAMGIGPGESGVMPMLIAMVALGWPSVARLVRGQVLQLREQPFVEAAQLMGGNTSYLIWRHMLPNVMGVVLVSLTFAIPSAIFTEAFLSFIGMGVAPPTPSWGSMCNDGVKSFLSHPHELLFPALFISLTVLAFNLLGDGLRDALDAKMKE